MKLNHVFPQPGSTQVIQRFGEAQLVRHPNGQHELIGGSASDFTATKEWVSMFAHDIVFSRTSRGPESNCRGRAKSFLSRRP